MRKTSYWEKGTSAAPFVKESKDSKVPNANSTGTKYFATSKWNSSLFENTRYNEDINKEVKIDEIVEPEIIIQKRESGLED